MFKPIETPILWEGTEDEVRIPPPRLDVIDIQHIEIETGGIKTPPKETSTPDNPKTLEGVIVYSNKKKKNPLIFLLLLAVILFFFRKKIFKK